VVQNCFQFVNQDRQRTLATHVRSASESRDRRRGLMGITDFAEGAGLWIVPCEAIHTFGMKVAIDSVFLDKELRVAGLRENLKPRRIAVCLRAHSVLELPAGVIANSGTRVGDRLQRVNRA
jgi:uncharacterized membrane protein (UPF0127 family)